MFKYSVKIYYHYYENEDDPSRIENMSFFIKDFSSLSREIDQRFGDPSQITEIKVLKLISETGEKEKL